MRIYILIVVFISMGVCAQTVDDQFYEAYKAKVASTPVKTDRVKFLLAASKGEVARQDIRKYISQGKCRGGDAKFLNIAYSKFFLTGGVSDILMLIETPSIEDQRFGLTLLIYYEPTAESVSLMNRNLHLAYDYYDSDDGRMLRHDYIRALGVLLTYDNYGEIDDIYKKIISRQTPDTEFRSKLIATIISMSRNQKERVNAKCRKIIKKCVLEEYNKSNLIAYFSYCEDGFSEYLQKIKMEQADAWRQSMTAEKIGVEIQRINRITEASKEEMEKRSAL